ncbi:MAG TPA: hypothetical protein VG347_13640 [Verrucomicrobiae bacterium]|nr:hypothetical protein [Verrucomicrobiae bacterium]
MKKNILFPAVLALVMAALIGCQRHAQEAPEVAVTNIASAQPTPDQAAMTNNVSSLMVQTNSMSPNNPAATNP